MSEIKKINVNGVDYDLASKYSHVHSNKNELDNLSTLYRDKNKANRTYAPSVKRTLIGPFIIENGVDGNLIDWSIWGTNIGNKNTTTGKYDIDITVSSKNMIPYPFYYTSRTINGITFTDNGDGTVTANGTATADAQFMLCNISWDSQTPIAQGAYYLSGCPNGGGETTYQLGLRTRTNSSSTDTITSIDYGNGAKVTITSGEPRFDTYIIIRKNTTVKNILFKPQLETGLMATGFELYSEPQTVKISLTSALNGLLTRSSAKVELPVFNRTTIYTFNTSAQPVEFKVKYSQNIETYIKENSLDLMESYDLYSPVGENTGVVPCTKNALSTNAKNYQIYGNSVQDGTPTPTTPIEVESVGDLVTGTEDVNYGKYKIETKVKGKNLIPFPYTDSPSTGDTVTKDGITFTVNGDGTITANGTATEFAIFRITNTNGAFITDNGVLSGCPAGGSTSTYYMRLIYYKDSAYNDISLTDTGSGIAVNTPQSDSDTQFIYIGITSGTTVSNLVFKPQLEYGSIATEYEPHRESIVTAYLDEPLRKIEDCADYIDYENLKVVKKVGVKVFDGSETNWRAYKTGFYQFGGFTNNIKKTDVLSNRFICTTMGDSARVYLTNTSTTLTPAFYDTGASTIVDWKAQLANWNTEGNPLKVYYALATPTEENVSLEPLPLENGINNVLTDTSVQPSNAMVQYYMDLKSIVSENALNEAEDTIALQEQIDKLTIENEKSALIQEKCTLTEKTSGVTVQTKNAVDISVIDYRIYGDSIQETDNGDFTNVSGEALVVPTGCIDVGYLKFSGNSVQDGTPTPIAPVDVESVGELITDESSEHMGKYKIVTNVCGKNLIPYPYYNSSITLNGITFTVNVDGSINVNGTATAEAIFHCGGTDWNAQTPILKGNYFLSGCPVGGSDSTYKIGLRTKAGSTGTAEIKAQDVGSGATVSITNDNTRFDVYVSIKAGATINNLTFSPQLEIGSTATTYEKYTATSMVAYLDEPLRKIEDYADCIDFENKKVIRQIKQTVFTGNETWSDPTGSNSELRMFITPNDKRAGAGGLCNKFTHSSALTPGNFDTTSDYISFNIYNIATTKAEWVTQLEQWDTENNPLKAYYVLAIPTSESITIESIKTSTGYTAGQSIVDMNILKGTLSATMYKSYPYPSSRKSSEVQCVGDLVKSTDSDYQTTITSGTSNFIGTTPKAIIENGGKVYRIEEKVYGKNLLPKPSATTKTTSGITITYDSNTQIYTINGTASSTVTLPFVSFAIPADTSAKYAISITYISGNVSIPKSKYAVVQFGKTDSINSSHSTWSDSGNLIAGNKSRNNISCSSKFIKDFWFYISDTVEFDNYQIQIQLEKNNVATVYEPYRETKITSYLDEPLRKIEDCADYIDYKNQKLIRNIAQKIFKGDGTDNISSNGNVGATYCYSIKYLNQKAGTAFCNYLVNNVPYSSDTEHVYIGNDSGYLFVPHLTVASVNTWLSKLYTSGNPLSVQYQLATPTEEDIEIESLPLENGVNNILCSTTTQPSNIDVEYFKDSNKEFSEIKFTLASLQSQIDELKNS